MDDIRNQLLTKSSEIRRVKRRISDVGSYSRYIIDLISEYNLLVAKHGAEFVESDSELAHGFCNDFISEVDDPTREPDRFRVFYSDEAEFVLFGSQYQYKGCNQIIHAIIDMFEGLDVLHKDVDIQVDNSKSHYFDMQVTCKSKLQINEDAPRFVTEVFHLHRTRDNSINAQQLFCSKHIFVVTDQRPLYINAEKPPFIEKTELEENDEDESEEDDNNSEN